MEERNLASQNKNIENLSFEEAMKELEVLVGTLEEGRLPLKEAIQAYERGTRLRRHNEKLLEKARLTLEEIVQDSNGALSKRPSALLEESV